MFLYTDNESLKNEIKKLMIDNGVTAKEVASKLNMSPQTFQHLVNKKQFSFADMKRICDAIECNLIIDVAPREK